MIVIPESAAMFMLKAANSEADACVGTSTEMFVTSVAAAFLSHDAFDLVSWHVKISRACQAWREPMGKLSPESFKNKTEWFLPFPGGGLDKPTGRDQRSWVFLNDPKKYFATNTKPKKLFSEKQNPKNTLRNTIYFPKVKHDMITMETHDY